MCHSSPSSSLQLPNANLCCLLGLVGTETDRQETQAHNVVYLNLAQNTKILNNSITEWLLGTVEILDDPVHTPQPDTYPICSRYYQCLVAPTTVFSNMASQNWWIKDHRQDPPSHYVIWLESPHNVIHLALGGSTRRGCIMPLLFAAPMAIWAIMRQLDLI